MSFLSNSNPDYFLATLTMKFLFTPKNSLPPCFNAPSCIKISQLWVLMRSSSLLFNKSTYFSTFMVVPYEGHHSSNYLSKRVFYNWGSIPCFFAFACSKRPPNPISSNRKLLYRRLVQKKQFFHISMSQLAYLLAKFRRFVFIACINHGFWAGLHGLRPNFRDNLR